MSNLFLIVIVMLIPVSINQFLILDLVLCSLTKTKPTKQKLVYTWSVKTMTKSSNQICYVINIISSEIIERAFCQIIYFTVVCQWTLHRYANNFHGFICWWLAIELFLLCINVSQLHIFHYLGLVWRN